jgi:hypothetical protein
MTFHERNGAPGAAVESPLGQSLQLGKNVTETGATSTEQTLKIGPGCRDVHHAKLDSCVPVLGKGGQAHYHPAVQTNAYRTWCE